jgi:hypothetical protein
MKISRLTTMMLLAGAVSTYIPGTLWAQNYTQWSFQNTTATAVQISVIPCTGNSQGCGPCAIQVPANGMAGPFNSAANANDPCVYCVGGPQYGPSNTVYGMYNGATNWGVAGPTSGITYNVILYPIGGGPAGGNPTTTNTGCITLANTTDQVQYYQFAYENPTVNGGSPQGLSGCSSSITASSGGSFPQQGNDSNTPNNFMAVYPGETVTVCHSDVEPNGSPTEFMAYQAPPGSYPCSLIVGEPRCVSLCGGDGVPVVSGAFGGSGNAVSITPESSGNGMQSSPNPNPGSTNNGEYTGTNGILWQDSQTNGGLMLDATGKEGFAAIHNDAVVGNAAATANTLGIENAIANAANSISGTIRSNSGMTGSNLSVNFTNFPTNYPDAQAIELLGTIASNTARTNAFDTNLDASAAAIASNTSAPLAYTNIGLDAYSTNPSDTVGYASNTLAGPVGETMQEYAQSAATAADNVNIGGSPGSLLVITFDLPGMGTYTIDCNPLDNPDIADFATWFRNAMEWLVGIGFVGMVLRDGATATRTAFLTPQGQFPKLMVLGNSVGWPLAALYIVAIIAALVAVPYAIVTAFSVGSGGQMWWQQVAVNPFSGAGAGRAVGLSLWLADQFMPMSYIVSSALYYITFRFTLNKIVTVAATIVRALMA